MAVIPWGDILRGGASEIDPVNVPRQIICRHRNAQPYFWWPSQITDALPPLANALDSTMNAFCQDLTPPITNDFFVGGQCPVQYDVYPFNEANQEIGWSFNSGGGALFGPITSIESEKKDVFGLGYPTQFKVTFRNAGGEERMRGLGAPIAAQAYDVSGFHYQLRRKDGLPDNCGNGNNIIIPPTPPPPTIIIPVIQGDRIYPVTVNLPDLNTGDWPDFTFAPTYEIGPITFRVLPEGLELPDDFFDIGPIDFSPEVNLSPVLNATANLELALNAQLGAININLQNIAAGEIDLSRIEELIERCCCKKGEELEIQQIATATPGGVFDLPSGSVVGIVSVVTPTPTTPTKSRSGGEPDVYFWGTFALCGGDASGGVNERLSYREQAIFIPDRANKILVTPHYGNLANIKVYKVKSGG